MYILFKKSCLVIVIFLVTILNIHPAVSKNLIASKKIPVTKVVSKTGIEAWLVEDSSIPVISMSFAFNGGMQFETDEKMGLNYMMSIMLDEGAGNYDSEAFQKILADNVISMSFTAERDFFSGSLKTLTKNKNIAFKMLKLALTEPHFNNEALKRMQRHSLNSIKNNLSNPNWNAARIFNGLTFEGHKYARPGQGNLTTIKNITPADLKNLAKKTFVNNDIKIAVAGDITKEQLATILDDIFASLPKQATVATDNKDKNAYNKNIAGKTILYKMDIPQTIVRFAQKGISELDKNYPTATILNYILGGGGFSSRLMEKLREEKGLTYGIYTYLSNSKHADLIQGSFSTKNNSAVEAIKTIKEEWQKIIQNGVSKTEVQDAINYLTGSLPLALTSTSSIANILNSIQKSGKDINYINERNQQLKSVTTDAVNKLAKEILKTDELHFITVGNPDELKPSITIDKLPFIIQ